MDESTGIRTPSPPLTSGKAKELEQQSQDTAQNVENGPPEPNAMCWYCYMSAVLCYSFCCFNCCIPCCDACCPDDENESGD